MLALRLVRGANPAVQFRRLLVAAASAGTGFLLLCTLGYAMGHPDASTAAVLRLAWCLAPIAATVQFAVAVARTDPATRPRAGLAAIGLGPGQLMILAAVSTAVSCTLGSMVALLIFLHLRGDLTGLPFDGDAAGFLAANQPLPLPATLTLLALVPALASAASAVVLRPRGPLPPAGGRPARLGGFGGYGRSTDRIGSGTYGRFGTHPNSEPPAPKGARETARQAPTGPQIPDDPHHPHTPAALDTPPHPTHQGARGTARPATADPQIPDDLAPEGARGTARPTPTDPQSPNNPIPEGARGTARQAPTDPQIPNDPHHPLPTPTPAPTGLPWGAAVLAAGLAAEAYAGSGGPHEGPPLPGGLTGAPFGVLAGWALTALGLALAGPALTHLCGRLLQSVRPSATRLLAGRVLMEQATGIGRPLGVLCAVASGTYAMAVLYTTTRPGIGPLTTLGLLLVAGCALATLLTAAVEARDTRADTTAALLRIGAPASALRAAAALRAGALIAVLTPLTWAVAELAAVPLAR
ncbi:hypothetical protein C6Y14_39675 [Streptomyces dioscori]|uniref:Uncharacterized protein n=1 Tax=Streptomyces dioscori TaxID=2109333 RepID=A0A2P8PVB5_9ACTN|nr:hypothetical protein [Streptomyces dioscori]PSM37943.1 hypothetical protein C6Y14_39675 [Streptomyces dioscori]